MVWLKAKMMQQTPQPTNALRNVLCITGWRISLNNPGQRPRAIDVRIGSEPLSRGSLRPHWLGGIVQVLFECVDEKNALPSCQRQATHAVCAEQLVERAVSFSM